MNPTLQGYAAAILEEVGPEQLPVVAEELAAIERLVLAAPLLHAALTDTAVTGSARAAVMRDLLEGRVSEPTRRAAAFATSAVHAPESLAALNWLAMRAHRAAEGQHEAEPSLGLLEARRRVGGYARAIFETMLSTQLEGMEDELFRFAQIVGSTPALRSALVNRDLPVEARQRLVTQLLEGKVQPGTLALVRYTIAGGRARDIVGTLNWLVEQTAAARGWRIARVRAAAPVDDAQQSDLSASLTDLAGSPVELQVVIERSLLSGAVIQIGDLQVDASARGRLDALREHLVPGGWDDRLVGSGQGPTQGTTTEGAV